MSLLERLPVPRRLSARIWLITLPSAVISFERRSHLPRMPLGPLRWLGVPLIAGGVALALWGSRRPDARLSYPAALSRLPRRPATAGGVLALTGVGLLLQSWMLCLYAAGVTYADGSDMFEVEEPEPASLLSSDQE